MKTAKQKGDITLTAHRHNGNVRLCVLHCTILRRLIMCLCGMIQSDRWHSSHTAFEVGVLITIVILLQVGARSLHMRCQRGLGRCSPKRLPRYCIWRPHSSRTRWVSAPPPNRLAGLSRRGRGGTPRNGNGNEGRNKGKRRKRNLFRRLCTSGR